LNTQIYTYVFSVAQTHLNLNLCRTSYTNSLVKSFAAQGTPIQFIQVSHTITLRVYVCQTQSFQIGNEINDGMLWPVGRISVNGYSPLSQLLHSAARGVRDASSSTKIMIHLANGWSGSAVTSFYNQIFISGQLATTDFDLFGFSFYPFYGTGATYAALKSSMQAVVTKFNKVCALIYH
jgi:arabinogalactan endo-1,4-beta-galactosidase